MMSNNSAESNKSSVRSLKENEKKWGEKTVSAGWILLPNILVERQNALGLSPLDVCIILNFLKFWWIEENRPFPSKETIANSIGYHPRTIQKRIEKLEKDGFLRREERRNKGKGTKGSQTNVYHLDGLIKFLKPYAEEAITEKKKREAEEKNRPKRKKPKYPDHLTLVSN